MKKLAFLLMLLILVGEGRAQEEFVPPPARKIARVPFRLLSGGIVILKATINNHPDSLHFILDTGSGGISLDSATHHKLNLPLTPSERTIRGLGGIKKVSFANNNKLHLPGLSVDNLNFHINDYDLLTSVYGIKIDGIIGYSVLSRYVVNINYDSSWMDFHTPGIFRYPKGGFMYRPLITSLPIMQVRVKDEHSILARYYFDTGAGLCMLFSKEFTDDSMFISRKRPRVLTQGEGLGGKINMELTAVKEVKLGPYKFKNVPAYVFDDEYNVTSYPFLGGLLGNDLLRRFNVILNYPRREFYLTPNTHFREAFDYSYTGLGIYYIDEKIEVVDVLPGSPGEKAGFRPGDYILGVGNVINKDILTYKTMLQQTNSRIRVIVMRDGNVLELYIKPRNILRRR